MGKVIGTIGVVVAAVALTATGIGAIAAPALAGAVTIGGVSASTLLLAGTALQAVGRVLTKQPKPSGSTTERLNASLVTDTPRKMVFGRTAMNTDLRYQEWWGGEQEYCSQVFVLASHHCTSLDEIWLDDKLAWTSTRGVIGEFVGYLVVQSYAQASAGSVFNANWSRRWGAQATFSGCATLYLQFKVTGNGKKGKSPFTSSITSRLSVVGKGAPMPDPRFDSTAGGNGALRVADQTTWSWAPQGYEVGRNPALALLFYLIGWRIQNPVTGEWKLAVGRGVPIDRINLDSFITAANLCDEPVLRTNGESEPRYRCDGTFSEGDDPSQVIANFETCMNAKLRDSAGRFSLQVLHNDLATPVLDFTDDDVLGDFSWTAGNDLNDRRNVVRGRYTDPSALYQLADFPQIKLPALDGIDRIESLDLALVQSPGQAQRLAKQRVQRQQYEGEFRASFNARGWAVKDGDIVRLTFSALGFDQKLFRVSEGLIDPTGSVPLVLGEEHPSIYAWDREESPSVQAGVPNTFDPLLLPIIAAIDDAGKTAEWPAIIGEGKPEDDATNSADPNSAFGPGTVGEAIATLDKIVPIEARFEPIESDISALEQAKVDTDASLVALTRATVDQDAVLRQIERDAGRLDETLLRLLSESSRTRAVLRDAGIVVDPVTGVVRIYAIDQLADRTSLAEIAIDGVNATVTTKASVDYVNEKIALAVLDPAQAAQLEPIIVRLTSAEQTIDGLNAVVALKAEAIELTRVSGTVTTVQEDLDALAGTVSTKAEKTVVDALGIAVGSVEQTLSTLGNVSGISVTIRQARAVADDAATASLRGLLAGDDADRRRIVAQSEIRQELFTKIVDGLSAEAVARTLLSVKVGDLDARSVQETTLQIAVNKVLGERIDALSIVAGDQAAAIATLTQATIGAGVGIAGIQTTIRQQSRDGDQSAEALLGSLIAGDQAEQRRAAQLVQIQTEFTSTLIANEAASAVARQALLARMGLAEAAIVTTSKAFADTTQALTSRIAAAEAVFNDAGTGLAATRARLIEEEKLRAAGDQANAEALAILSAQVNDPATGLPVTAAEVNRVDRASADRDTAIGETVAQVSARIADPETGLAAIAADIVQLAQARVSGDEANADLIQQVRARLDSVGGVTIEQRFEALVEATGRILGTVTVAIDTNGNMNGTQLVGSPDGRGSLNLINTDFRMGTGRVIFNDGTFMQVQGVAFGVARDLLEWFGPTMAIDQCSRANAKIYKAIDGDAYFGGSLSAGILRNASSSSGLSVSEVAQVGPFGSNGLPVKYVASWAYRTATSATYAATNEGLRQYNAAAAGANAPSDGTGGNFGTKTTEHQSSSIVLSRAFSGGPFTDIDQRGFTTQTTTFSGLAPTIGDAPGRADITTTIGGGFTVNDPVQSAFDRTVKLTLARGFTAFGDAVFQRLTIVATEE